MEREIIESAKRVNLIDFLCSNGYQYKKCGTFYKFEVNGHTIEINSKTPNLWTRWSVGEYLKDNISLLTKYLNFDFTSAVNKLSHQSYSTVVEPKTNKPSDKTLSHLELKEEIQLNGNYVKNAYAYLINTRKIDKNIITQLFTNNLISTDNHANITFFHYDIFGKNIVGYSKHGTNTYKTYKRESKQSQSFFMISVLDGKITKISNVNSIQWDILVICESPIDTISFFDIFQKRFLKKSALLISLSSIANYKRFVKWYQLFKIESKKIIISLDNDTNGIKTMKELQKNIPHGIIYIEPLQVYDCKDWNEFLTKNKNRIDRST